MEILRQKLAMAVKSIQWSYAIFWSISSTETGVLTWCDGYYNGDIKTRKTIQAEEINEDDEDEMGLQRTEQLRQLYESLSAASEYEPQTKRPAAALSPEDLTDTEWYFLVCMTFEFDKGQGLPGRTLAKNTTSWLSNAHFADSKVFSRSLLAKSASIQTVVCFPYLEGVVEFGITEKVLEEQSIVEQIKASIFDAPSQRFLEIPLESSSGMLDRDRNLVLETRDSPKNSLDRSREWRFVDDDDDDDDDDEDEDGEVSFFRNNSVGSNDLWSDDDSRYQCVLSTIFKNTRRLILGPRFANFNVNESGFVRWKNDGTERRGSRSQMLLKKVLYEVPKMLENRSVWPGVRNGFPEADDVANIDKRFSVLGSLVPSRRKVFDKVSLLDDTIEYLKSLEKRVESLQSTKHVDRDRDQERTSENYANKRKASSDLEDLREDFPSDCITVSAIENDVTIEIRCRWRDNMMVQVFDAMSSLDLVSHSVHSSTVNGILSLSIESKFEGCTASTAKMIRRALQRVIGRYR